MPDYQILFLREGNNVPQPFVANGNFDAEAKAANLLATHPEQPPVGELQVRNIASPNGWRTISMVTAKRLGG